MFEQFAYVGSEEKRKDMLRQAAAAKRAFKVSRSSEKKSYRHQLIEEASAALIHAGRFLRLLVRIDVSAVESGRRAGFSGPRI